MFTHAILNNRHILHEETFWLLACKYLFRSRTHVPLYTIRIYCVTTEELVVWVRLMSETNTNNDYILYRCGQKMSFENDPSKMSSIHRCSLARYRFNDSDCRLVKK